MDSTVAAIILASLLAFVSAQSQWSPECALENAFCDPQDAQWDAGQLSDPGLTLDSAAEECYALCNAQKEDPTSPCKDFTVRQTGNRPATCYLLREDCITNIVDDCIAAGKCISGPNDCTEPPQTCPMVASLPEGYSRWQCVDINMDPINPYSERPPVGTTCFQTCPSWVDSNDNDARLVSVCEEGATEGEWGAAQNVDGNELTYPPYPTGETSYPKPDADELSALTCGCQPLEVRWPYPDPANGVVGGDFYNPNDEPAADFICDNEIVIGDNNEYLIETNNVCVLYCDDHYVATAKCQNGEWLGNPEWGFWCYEEPQTSGGGGGEEVNPPF